MQYLFQKKCHIWIRLLKNPRKFGRLYLFQSDLCHPHKSEEKKDICAKCSAEMRIKMRLRNIPGADAAIAESEYCIQQPALQKGNWQSQFPSKNPLHIEVGMGKGRFIMDMAAANPNVNYLGIERYSSVLLRALQKMELNPLPNLKFICMDATELAEVFAPAEVSRIYLNFSDPWPKDRHAKRRLTSRQFFARYDQILAKDGRVEFKTDNQELFTFSLEEISAAGWTLTASTRDLHHDAVLNEGNIMTEYEEKFSSLGNPICKLIAMR
jgi:tRNA (guanine-N7-)-methyltransferase